MIGCLILAFVFFGCIIAIALIIGCMLEAGDGPKGEVAILILLAITCTIFCVYSLKKAFQSEVRAPQKPEISLEITTNVTNGFEKSDTLYIYKFKQ